MPRRNAPVRREIVPDAVYGNRMISRFISKLMLSGKKSLAERIMYGAFRRIEQESKRNPVEIFDLAMRNVTPALEVKPRRVGGATYQVPVEIRGERRVSLAMRWLVGSARKRHGRSMVEKLAAEFMEAAHNQGATVKRQEDTHRMAEANRAFVHYRW